MEVLLSNGNPFEEHSGDLVTLDNKVCESAAAAVSVHEVESMGQKQYSNFRQSVLDSNDTPLTAPIKRNNLLLFHKKTQNKSAIKLKMQHFKRHAELYGQAFLVLDSRGGIWRIFFSTNLPHTHLHCHPKGPSTLVLSQICWYIYWEPVQAAPFLSTRS